MEVSKEKKVDLVILSKQITSAGAEYATLKTHEATEIDFGDIIKSVCGRYIYSDLFDKPRHESAVGLYFSKCKKQKAKLEIVLLSSTRLRVRVGTCTFAEYSIKRTSRKGSLYENIWLQHNATLRPKGVRYDDYLMSSNVVERHALAWVKEQDRRKPKAVR